MILGVSCDPPGANRAFREKFGFPFDLLCDESGVMSAAYGALETPGRGKPARMSYLLDTDGRVLRVYAKVSAATHAGDVLADMT